jgi:hypothetical protein
VGAAAWSGASLSRRGLLADWLLSSAIGCALFCWQRRALPALLTLVATLGLLFGAAHVKFAVLGDWPRWSDLSLLREASVTLPRAATGGVVAVGAALVAASVANLRRPTLAGLTFSAMLLAAAAAPLLGPGTTLEAIDRVFAWRPWVGNDPFSRGLLVALARDAAVTRRADRVLAGLEPLPQPRPRRMETLRNLHLLLAESLTFPHDLGDSFPLASFDSRLAGWSRGRALSPQPAGGSAQSEFELLCGLPATAALPDPVVFNGLRGRPVPCLPRRLAVRGYDTFASVPVEPWFYNARYAYRSVGFLGAHFRPDLPPATRRGSAFATRELMRHNRKLLEARLAGGQPLFNYLVTVEPHYPFDTPTASTTPLQAGSALRTGLANGLRDATRAIADHVEWLVQRDPDALIVVLGDHQAPGLAEAAERPAELLTRLGVPLALLDAGEPRSFGPVPHFQLSERLLALLEGVAADDLPKSWLRPLRGGRALHSAGDGVEACPAADSRRCPEALARAAALESRTQRLVAMAR